MKHIVFDVDGTLIDTEQALLHSLRDTMQEITGKQYPLSELTFAMGIPSVECMQALQVRDIPGAIALWDKKSAEYSTMVQVFSGIRQVLEALTDKGCHLGIVTSRSRQEFQDVVPALGIDRYFPVIICADDTQSHKPEPEPLLKYAELTGAELGDMVYIGDSPYDKACADSAGVAFYLAAWGAGKPVNVESRFRLENPMELLEQL